MRSLSRDILRGMLAVGVAALVLTTPDAAHGAVPCTGGTMVMVAHQDDDLLFVNPDIQAEIAEGRCVSAVFVTAGDAGRDVVPALDRELGPQAAYARMADVPDQWTTSHAEVAGRTITVANLVGAPRVSLVFLRLPDGGLNGGGYSTYGNQSLRRLWTGDIERITAIDDSARYTRRALISTLSQLMTDQRPSTIRTMDYVSEYGGGDHPDHYMTARFVQAAQDDYGSAHSLVSYQGYPTGDRPQNVFGQELAKKLDAIAAYSVIDGSVMDNPWYANIAARRYVLDTTAVADHALGNRAPLAVAGADQVVQAGSLVMLDGSKSSDPDGDALTYQWTQTGGPAVSLSARTTARPTFTAPAAGSSVRFSLVVSDGALSSDDDVVAIESSEGQSAQNVARTLSPTVTASTEDPSQPAAKAVDGSPLGYPANPRHEWVTLGQRAGAWIQLVWSQAVQTDRVVLYDRPNGNDRVTGGTLTFSDGSTVTVPTLNNDGSATTVTFPQRSTTSVRFTVDSVSAATENVGLAELEVWGTPE